MPKQAVSLTLDESNLLWLRGQAARQGGNLSAVLNQLVSDARTGGHGSLASARSVVGTIDIAADDPGLKGADKTIRRLFAESLSRPLVAREAAAAYGGSSKRARRRG